MSVILNRERPQVAVRLARPDELEEVAALRARGYGRHAPHLGEILLRPEPDDLLPGNVVVVARALRDDRLVGTMRLHGNRLRPLPVEASLALPEDLRRRRLAEVTRLTVVPGARDAKLALFKTCYQSALAADVDHLVVAGRHGVWQQYRAMLFTDVLPGLGVVPLRHAGGLPHRVMQMSIKDAERVWAASGHPWLEYMAHDRDPALLAVAAQAAAVMAAATPPRSTSPVQSTAAASAGDTSPVPERQA